jgi:hypothetical protein
VNNTRVIKISRVASRKGGRSGTEGWPCRLETPCTAAGHTERPPENDKSRLVTEEVHRLGMIHFLTLGILWQRQRQLPKNDLVVLSRGERLGFLERGDREYRAGSRT